MWRFKIISRRLDTAGENETEAVEFLDAPDAETARRRASWPDVIEIRRVPDDEGRGPLWRLLRNLGIV